MIEFSYRNDRDLILIWGDGKGIFYPLLSLNLSIIFLVIDTENMKVIFTKRESSLQGIWPFILGSENTLNGIANPRQKNSQSFIISIGQTICKENIIEVNLEQIVPPEKDSRRTYYRLEQCFPWIWTVLNTIFNDFNNKPIRGIRCFKNVQTPEFRSFTPLLAP